MKLQELYNQEIAKSEKYRTTILIALLFLEALLLFVIYSFNQAEYLRVFKSTLSIYAILIFTGIIVIYEFSVHFLLLNKMPFKLSKPQLFGFYNSFFEISLLSLLLVVIILQTESALILQSPATLTYFIFIVLSTLRLNFKLSVFTGLLAAIEFVFIATYFTQKYPMDSVGELAIMQFFAKGMILFISGIAAGFVAKVIKSKMQLSWKNTKEKMEIMQIFGQQISPEIAESLIKNKNQLSGARRKVCIMFLDIRNFSEYVEDKQPEEVVAYLNQLFEFMIAIIQKNNGVINQFLGDGFMATFGAPLAIGNCSQNAVKAGDEIIQKLKEEIQAGKIPKTKVGIGLHYNEAVIGNVGSALRKQFSITGKVVILASRIEQLNKKYGTSFLISKAVFQQIDTTYQEKFEFLTKTTVKGSEKEITLFTYKNDKE